MSQENNVLFASHSTQTAEWSCLGGHPTSTCNYWHLPPSQRAWQLATYSIWRFWKGPWICWISPPHPHSLFPFFASLFFPHSSFLLVMLLVQVNLHLVSLWAAVMSLILWLTVMSWSYTRCVSNTPRCLTMLLEVTGSFVLTWQSLWWWCSGSIFWIAW